MKECKQCKVKVNSDLDYCPLCFEELEGQHEGQAPYQYKDKTERAVKNEYMLVKIFTFLSICVIAICGVINILTRGVAWSLLCAICIAYLWILVRHTILSRRGYFEKIILQVLFIIGIVLYTNLISGGGDWFIKYVLPAMSLTLVTILSLIILISKKRKNYLFGFFIIYLMLEIMSTILVACKFDAFRLINIINLLFTGLVMVGTLIFGFKHIKQEFSKKFHL